MQPSSVSDNSHIVPFIDINHNKRLRDMCRQALVAALADKNRTSVEATISTLKDAMGWDRPQDWSTTAGTGILRKADPAEIEAVKSTYNAAFTHIRFFVGELTCSNPAADVVALRHRLENGDLALSTAYKAVRKQRSSVLEKQLSNTHTANHS